MIRNLLIAAHIALDLGIDVPAPKLNGSQTGDPSSSSRTGVIPLASARERNHSWAAAVILNRGLSARLSSGISF